ncbi:nuclear localization sequence-binding protein-like [Leptopilina heterotoma]|uniref:nuclear localization sequence-binding protein-like n=1 Tax=Leptopilina heterotoma TaxID=63436 RepID=UPI001CA9E22F|nr:nuclear localization sequence-binding protein-like [Leptopilina heterotoma]
MKNKTKKRSIDELGGEEDVKNSNEGQKQKKMKQPHLNPEGNHISKKKKSNLTEISQPNNTSVLKKTKKKKNLENTEKLNKNKSSTNSCDDEVNVNSDEVKNVQIKEKIKDLKARQAKREKRKQMRKDHGQFKVRDVPLESIQAKIAEIEGRENISKTAKRKLRAFKRKLLDVQGISSPPSEKPKLTKSQKKMMKQEKSKLQTVDKSEHKDEESSEEDNLSQEIETLVVSRNEKIKKKDVKLNKAKSSLKSENKKKSQTAKNSKILIENKEDSSEEDNEESEMVENESEDDSPEESSQLMDENESNASDEEDNSSDKDIQQNNEMKELKTESLNNTKNDDLKKTVQKPIKQKQQKNDNKNASKQEGSEKKKRYVLFVGNLPFQSTVEDIKKHFLQKVSQVISVRIPTEKGSKKPRGFAYVEVTNSVDYEKALSLHHTNLQGFKIKVEYTQTGSKNIKNKQEVVAKNKKLHALRKAGLLAGSKKRNDQRNFRRKHLKNQGSEIKSTAN